eukprot:277761-Chlamydomonas_euryale.AAC.1
MQQRLCMGRRRERHASVAVCFKRSRALAWEDIGRGTHLSLCVSNAAEPLHGKTSGEACPLTSSL